MTNPTLEQRAREWLAASVFDMEARADILAFRPSMVSASIATRAMLTFSHTGVEQAIEACAKVEWRPIETAPKDGTDIIAWCVHPNAEYADTTADKSDWQAPVVARWIDHNGGGWTWHGLAGRFTHWTPAPKAPDANPLPAQSPDDIAYAGAVQGETYAQFQQKRGRLPDLIEEAIDIYTGFMKDDDYNAQGCLDSVVAKLKTARDWYPGAGHPDIPAPSPVNVEGLVEALRPFSMALGTVAPDDFERWPDGMTIEFEGFCEYITVGDLRRARQALASLPPDGER